MDARIGQYKDILHFEDSFTSSSNFHIEVNIKCREKIIVCNLPYM